MSTRLAFVEGRHTHRLVRVRLSKRFLSSRAEGTFAGNASIPPGGPLTNEVLVADDQLETGDAFAELTLDFKWKDCGDFTAHL